jgi:hypothetical protein
MLPVLLEYLGEQDQAEETTPLNPEGETGLRTDREKTGLRTDREKTSLRTDREKTVLRTDREKTGLRTDREKTGLRTDREKTGLRTDREKTGLPGLTQSDGRRRAGSQDQPKSKENRPGLRAIWITPIRALTREIQAAAQRAATDLGLDWDIAIRSGDTATKERTRQRKTPPQILITTPESLHLLLASKEYDKLFADLRVLIADEWHELLGSKRGVLLELALSRLRGLRGRHFAPGAFPPRLATWKRPGMYCWEITPGRTPLLPDALFGRSTRSKLR